EARSRRARALGVGPKGSEQRQLGKSHEWRQSMTRREWMRIAGQSAAAVAMGRWEQAVAKAEGSAAAETPVFCLFSKHLPDLGWSDLGNAVKDAGFDGIDLTVRTGGHVLPERAAEDLPRAIEAITAHGLKVPMVTTELTSATAPTAKPL